MAADETRLTATEWVAAYSAGERSPVEATRQALDRIEKYDRELNAYVLVDAEGAMAAAEESAQRWEQGNPIGMLDGVPVSIKDMFLTAGMPTVKGSRAIDPEQEWTVDAPVSARLREHGAVVLGKTTTPELGWKGVTDSPLSGVTRNPWNRELTAGGSSGGSAVAVATGMGALSVGTDGGGSIRIPASFCGIAGLKPTHGRVPVYPASAFGPLSHSGPMAVSVDDLALLLDVLAQPDHRDPTSPPPPAGSYREAVRRDVRGLVVAYSPNLGYVDVDPQVDLIVREAVEALADAGLRVELVDPGFADPADAFEVLWSTGAAYALDGLELEDPSVLDPGLAALWQRGQKRSAGDYLNATAVRTQLGIAMGEFHQRYDLLLTPTIPILPFAAGHDVPPDSDHLEWPSWTPFTYPFNMTQQPAASVPAGFTSEGLPVGLQVVGPRHSDDLVLAVCRLFETVRPWVDTIHQL
ncbi:amidase [Fodinicola feengrottensis]|uniref:amidase n=1 Tax=Fodinicola feengrottensis TaxID=435914 RepID=A0ABN2IQY8_9ACTN